MDELDGRSDVPGQPAKRISGSTGLVLAGVCALVLVLSACGTTSVTPLASSGGTNEPATSTAPSATAAPKGTAAPNRTASQPLLIPKASCPLTAATVSAIVGERVYDEPSSLPGSCAFDSVAGGQGLRPSEVRVDILTGQNDLTSLYAFFSQEVTKGLASCQPYRLLRPSDLGPGGFETLCGATATVGPSSVDDYLPLQGDRALTVTVNRGVAVGDHRLLTCEAEAAAVVAAIRTSW